MSRSLQPSWLRARKLLLQRVKEHIGSLLGPLPRDLYSARKRYEKEFGSGWTISSSDELLKRVEESRIVLGADFHAHVQSQRTHLRILRSLPQRKKIMLALEVFPVREQRNLDLYLQKKLTEAQFLKRIRWDEVWGFPWKHYRPLLQLAQERGYKVVALNSSVNKTNERSLNQREKMAVQVLQKKIKTSPEALIYIVFGDLHLSRAQLPQKLLPLLKKPSDLLVIHQDSESLYFKLAIQKVENKVSVLRKGKNHFCVMTSPPWVRWQNYQLFLEGEGEQELEMKLDPTEWVRHLLQVVMEDLSLKLPAQDFEAFDLQSENVWRLLEKNLSQKELLMAQHLMGRNRSFFLPGKKNFILLSHNINHVSALCGDYLQCQLSGRKTTLWNFSQDFEAAVWLETLCFFASKLMNHRRKPDRIEDLMTQGAEMKETLLLVLGLKMKFLKWAQGPEGHFDVSKKFKPRRKSSYFHAAQVLGGLLGERLFANYRSGVIRSKKVQEWMAFDVYNESFHDFFKSRIKQLEVVPSWLEEQDVRL
ncbi:MAG: ChaN family lipoprotein [Bdellovibrionales bacterium]